MILRKGLLSCFGIMLCLASSVLLGQEKVMHSKREFAPIDIRLANDTIEVLAKGDAEKRLRTIQQIKDHPENFAPPVFYVLSNVLFQLGNKDDAAFWFYAGQLRARFDANRCTDISAREAVDVLNQQFGPPINQYTFQDISKLEVLIPRVVEWDRRTPHQYDNRWINLHGMDVVMYGMDAKPETSRTLSAPREEWEEIAEKTREDYLNGFKEAIAQIKN